MNMPNDNGQKTREHGNSKYKITWEDMNPGAVKISSLQIGQIAYTQYWASLDAVGGNKDWGCTRRVKGTSNTPIMRTEDGFVFIGPPVWGKADHQ